ncbi:DNA-binding protein HU-beta [Bacillus phage SP8]|uniref:Transcription factor n=1 Tax=Bacillus phage Adastra TaxID=3143958 RepID=A0AAU8BCH8_9CAUD|nr:DNA-binding protein HU-beta [Bacillus phage SP8]
MNKTELIKAIAQDTELTQVAVSKVLASFESITTETVAKGDKVQLTGFLNIKPVARQARKGFNPQTQEALEIAPSVGVSVKAGESLKKAAEGLKYEDFAK